jgi:transposase
MAVQGKGRRSGHRSESVQKPRGVIHPRVQEVGPERFGLLCVDPAKARSKWMLADFFGNVLIEPAWVAHNAFDLQAAVERAKQAAAARGLRDQLVAIERTGRYHEPVRQAFAAAGWETRLVHPFATKRMRQPEDPGVKTDDTDLAAIFRATINGFALSAPVLDETWTQFRLLTRFRRNLVQKSSTLCCQIREALDAALPGYGAVWGASLWSSPLAIEIVRHYEDAAAIHRAGLSDLECTARAAGCRTWQRTLEKVMAWAQQAAPAHLAGGCQRRLALAWEADRSDKSREIQTLEAEIAGYLARTPYLVLLSIPGVNVVSAAEFAAEMGPIAHYASGRAITGRAGLYPSRYQSDRRDLADGPLVRQANRQLRAALMTIADNLLTCNRYFRTRAAGWKLAGKDVRKVHVQVASRFARIAFHMVAGQEVFRHPCTQERSYVLQKLLEFHRLHQTKPDHILHELHAAAEQLPLSSYPDEAAALRKHAVPVRRSRQPRPIGEIVVAVLARLGVSDLQSDAAGPA